ncbi:unnamed protein product [Adineta ricciae]|uniref:Tumor susceptibility gene 101 protein n=1 Tax=Adineta ricciae TaxID=249248 RepID=A0A815FE67_ADIRI|nr:unnamed protein product [Adineta ricciae]CAF1325370.1 unnamed protein product [Adineta ricciae]
MPKQSQNEVDQMVQRARPLNRDVVRRDLIQAVNSSASNLVLKLCEYFYNDGTSKELLCLCGTVTCHYKGSRYNIPVEIWLQPDHPNSAPLGYVKPTTDMYVSSTSKDVQPDGTIVIPYLKNWRHPNSDLNRLLTAMSDAFSQSPPVFSNAGSATPYPTTASMPTPQTFIANTGQPASHSFTNGTSRQQNLESVYRASLESAVEKKITDRLRETVQISNVQIDSLRKTEQDLTDGQRKLQTLINDAQQQQTHAQNYIATIRAKTNEMLDAAQKMSSAGKENSVKDDAVITPAPVYKQLLQAYAEEHAIQDLLYYLAEGLRRESIGLDTYLKHVRELSRKQFILRATMHRCRQIAGLSVK